MEFKLNPKEQRSLLELVKAIEVLYDIDQLNRSYTFSPSGIGNKVEIRFTGYRNREKVFELSKDITDYDSW